MTFLLILAAIAVAFAIGTLIEASHEWDRILDRLLPEAPADHATRRGDFSAAHDRLDEAARLRSHNAALDNARRACEETTYDGGDAA